MEERAREGGSNGREEEAAGTEVGVPGRRAEWRLRPVRVLAVSGSLRTASSNTALLRAAARLAPEGVEVILYEGLASLPHFNPDLDDLDAGTAPPAVMDFRSQLDASDGVLISSPEYAHGVPGALLTASMTATHAYAFLAETLTTADANVIEEASVRVGLPTNRMDEAGILADPKISGELREAVAALTRAIELREPRPTDERSRT